MSTLPFYSPKFRASDSNGNPLAGGLLYSYSAGTTTPLATYTTRAGSVANANPVVLDANGEADVWVSPGVDYKFELRNSLGVVQWTVDNVPTSGAQSASTDEVTTDPGGRLSLTSATPVTTSDVTGATTVYYVPYKSDKVPLYDGAGWALYSIATELSQTTADTTKSPAAVANNSNYDMFIWNDSGTLRLSRGPAWSSGTSRGTGAGTSELERVNGRLVNKVSISNGPAAQRGLYVGSIGSDGSAQINDSGALRFVANAYHWLPRPMKVVDATNSWNYTTDTLRQANGSAANQLGFLVAQPEMRAHAEVVATAFNGSNVAAAVGIGLDSTTVDSSDAKGPGAAAADATPFFATYSGFPGIGRHTLVWLERSFGSGTTVWQGDNGANKLQSGIRGEVMG